MKYSATQLLNGSAGNALKTVALGGVNFQLGAMVSNHPSLKMPTEKHESPDALRDLVQLPELEGRDDTVRLDTLVTALVASCALIKDLANLQDFNDRGQIVRPFAWMINTVRTPASAVENNYAWRSDMAAKTAGERAMLLGIKDSKAVEEKAKARTDAENQERKNYALAEVNSLTHTSIFEEEETHLIEILLDLNCIDIVKIAKTSAEAQVKRAKARLLNGQYVTIDDEVLLFANS